MGIVEAAVAIAPRLNVRASKLSILVARTPVWFAIRFPLARSFAAMAMPLMRAIRPNVCWSGLRAWIPS